MNKLKVLEYVAIGLMLIGVLFGAGYALANPQLTQIELFLRWQLWLWLPGLLILVVLWLNRSFDNSSG